jgi:Holliday junction resolvase RusA-like endonuclease
MQQDFAESFGGDPPFEDAVHLEAVFAFTQPKSTPAFRRDFTVKAKGSDLDKLVRAVGDSLERSHVLGNDSQIAGITAVRVFTPHVLSDVGVRVTVTPFVVPTKG